MTLTPCDLAFAAIAAPEPESRFTNGAKVLLLLILDSVAVFDLVAAATVARLAVRCATSTTAAVVVVATRGHDEAHREHHGDEPDGSLLHVSPPPGMDWLIATGRSSAAPASPTARASAPSTWARSPSTPATTRADSAAAGSAARRTELRTPSSSRSPAAARSPPTTRRWGLSTLKTNAAAWPTLRPASAITRRQPRSPSRARPSICVTVSSPWLRRRTSSSAPLEAVVSRQPRFPQRQTAPSGSTSTWPSSPAIPPQPR